MKITEQQYEEMVKASAPKSTVIINCAKAFLVGGAICAGAQLIYNQLHAMGFSREDTGTLVAAILIVSAILLTALRVYDRLGKFAGAGSIVPITGFANAIAAPAIEHKKEGLVLGIGAKMFLIAGPVIVYGTLTSVIVGLIYYFVR
ncbi:MAG: stage V sporulation protein AC [Defluviitaleaceae bacterium]|nr:stage V sporulation protein AC [Defluviitaleaceae bacterium]MCL2199290.1 stage V sporulation protein AC [Defluviitaleaceae bacterium]